MQDTDVMDYALTAFKFFVENLKKETTLIMKEGFLKTARTQKKNHTRRTRVF